MGLSSSKTKSNTNYNSTSTTTPSVPGMISDPTSNALGQIGSLINQPVQTTPASTLQTQAFGGARSLLPANMGPASNATNALLDYAPSSVSAGSLADADLSKYMNPYNDAVLSSVIGDLNKTREEGVNGNSAAFTQGAGNTGWAGGRAGVADANTNNDFYRTLAATDAQLRQQGFTNAQNAAQFDITNRQGVDEFNSNQDLAGANFRLGAANQAGDQALAGSADQRATLGTLADLGGQQHAIDQENNPQSAQLQYISNILQVLGYNPALFTSQNTTGSGNQSTTSSSTPSLVDTIGSIVQTLGSMGIGGGGGGVKLPTPSDRRLKRDASLLGTDAKGHRWWSYRYLWDEDDAPLRIGVMAQEARRISPDAVVTLGGFLAVHYEAL